MGAVFLPMGITVYNSFLVPLVGIVWAADGDPREIGCQMLTTCFLLPYEVATSFFGCTGVGGAADIVGELEGSLIEMTAASSDLTRRFDEDGSGRVDRKEFVKAVEAVGLRLPSEELDLLFDEVDSDNSGTVSAKELHRVLKEGQRLRDVDSLEAQLEGDHGYLVEAKERLKCQLTGQLSEIAQLFKQWDTNGNGRVDDNEWHRAVLMCGIPASRETCDAVFTDLDSDGSGQLQYIELLRSLLRDALADAADRVIEVVVHGAAEAKEEEAAEAGADATGPGETGEAVGRGEGGKAVSNWQYAGALLRLSRDGSQVAGKSEGQADGRINEWRNTIALASAQVKVSTWQKARHHAREQAQMLLYGNAWGGGAALQVPPEGQAAAVPAHEPSAEATGADGSWKKMEGTDAQATSAAPEATRLQVGPPSKGRMKRLKREAFLLRVRARREEREAST